MEKVAETNEIPALTPAPLHYRFAANFTCDLPKNTLMMEYVGAVRLWSNDGSRRSPNDDEFAYITQPDADTPDAIIYPFPYANMARFLGGVNNITGQCGVCVCGWVCVCLGV